MSEWFVGKLAVDVTVQDLHELVEKKVAEDQRLDFKQEMYEPVKREEMLKDVTALANSDGGYLVIGVREENGRACGLVPVDSLETHAQAIWSSCSTNISPRIDGLEVRPVSLPQMGGVILVRVPASARGPHMYIYHNRTQFVRRYGTENRAMTMAEIREAIMGDSILREIAHLREVIGDAAGTRRPVMLGDVSAEDDALETSAPQELDRLMGLRFKRLSGSEAFFRVYVVPEELERQALDVYSHAIQEIVRNPPRTRDSGWVMWNSQDIELTSEGIISKPGNQFVTVLSNGYVEFAYPARGDAFQWKQNEEESKKHPYLYPYAVCEFTVNFVRFANDLYKLAGISLPVSFRLEFLNIRGFRLFPGLPGRDSWMREALGGVKPYAEQKVAVQTRVDGFPLSPDPLAYELLTKVYQHFGNKAEDVPLFDEQHHFVTPQD